MQSKAMQSNAKQCEAVQSNANPCNSMQSNAKTFKAGQKKRQAPDWSHTGFILPVVLCFHRLSMIFINFQKFSLTFH
jgi:hypothetical protein